jgi:hypothetical protein
MAAIFQIRRGDSSNTSSLQNGELYLNTAEHSLQVGTNSNPVKLLSLNTASFGDIILTGSAYISGDISLGGTITIGDTTSDSVVFNADLSSSIIPDATNTYDLGASNKLYRNVYATSGSFTNLVGLGNVSSLNTRIGDLEWTGSNHEGRMDLLETAMSGSNRRYVSPEGIDTNDGTEPHKPFKTIKAAVASLGSAVASNIQRTTIFVGSGNYTENNPIALPPGVAIVGDTLRTVRLTAQNPTKDFFHVHDSTYFYGLRFLNLQNPAFAFSFPCSTANATINAGGVSGITLVHTESGYVNGESVSVIIEGPDAGGTAATATASVSGGILSITMVSNGSGYVTGEKPHISIQAPTSKRPIIGTSPYVQNCSSITGPFTTDGTLLSLIPGNVNYAPLPYNVNDVRNQSNNVIGSGIIDEQGAGGGIRIDGNLVSGSSPLESFVADAFTQVNQGGPGHLVINKGYAQFVSCFTTFCTYGFKTANGGFTNISNSVIDFGKYGLVSKTYFPQTYNTGSSLETKTSTVSGFVIDENGAGYTGSVAGVTITGGGASVQATAEANVNANGSIDEIVLLTGGSGYTTQPSVTIDTPTGPGAILATTVNGKALISGVTEILMSLESGSRGIDISSNMILNGVDYLVTDVAVVGGQPNQRRVTTYPAPPSVVTNDQIYFHQLSNISTGGLVMEYAGSGVTYNALPKYGGVPIRTREINEFAPGRVFYSTVDNIGNLKIGDFFAVNQLTGEVTIDANSFNLAGLNTIGPFKRNGAAVGVVLQEVSNNTALLNSQGLYGEDTVPTQYAVKGYVDVRDARLSKLEQTSGSLNTFSSSTLSRVSNLETTSGSHNSRLTNLETKSASVDISVSNLHSYTSSLNNAIQLTGSTVSFLGNIIVYGTQSVINSTNLEVADNMIYLNSTSSTTNVDLGIVGNYNDGTYGHTGIYRDASDGVWRVFKGYAPEPEGNIDLAHASYRYADFYANALSASTLSGIGNITSYSTSVNSRLIELETKSGSIDNSILILNQFSASVTSSLEKIYQTTSSLNSATASLYTSASLMTASIVSLTSSVAALQSFSGNVQTKFDNLQTYTTSVDSRFTTLRTYTASLNETTASLNVFTESTNTRLGLLEISTGSLNAFSSSTLSRLGLLETSTGSLNIATASLYISTSLMTSSIVSLNQFSSSATMSIVELYWTASNHEGRIDYIELQAFGGVDLQSVSASLAVVNSVSGSWITESETGSFEKVASATHTLVSGSSQILGGTGIISGSSQIISLLPNGVVSGSTQLGNYVATITGTSNQVLVAGSGLNNASVTLSTPQDIASTSNVQFNSLGIGMAASATAGRIDATGDIVAYSTSDERLKENIQPIQNALSKVENISGNEYNWKEEFENIHGFKGNDVGVIAQEIQKILPEAVIERDNGYLGVNYEKIIPLLIQSIKELSLKVKELENK